MKKTVMVDISGLEADIERQEAEIENRKKELLKTRYILLMLKAREIKEIEVVIETSCTIGSKLAV